MEPINAIRYPLVAGTARPLIYSRQSPHLRLDNLIIEDPFKVADDLPGLEYLHFVLSCNKERITGKTLTMCKRVSVQIKLRSLVSL